MVQQIEIILKPKRRGFHLVTSEILSITIPITDGRLNLDKSKLIWQVI